MDESLLKRRSSIQAGGLSLSALISIADAYAGACQGRIQLM